MRFLAQTKGRREREREREIGSEALAETEKMHKKYSAFAVPEKIRLCLLSLPGQDT